MALIVQKYGGTSVSNPDRIRNIARRVARYKADGHQIVVVVSAMSGETNRLISLAKEIMEEPDPRELDVMVSTGEQVTIGMTAMALMQLGIKAKSYTGRQAGILTNTAYT
ncbi:MAG TPA: aspartate kinase, partial [Methylophilaceae bacterium]|nr:aspartate kinase [Methylophilaceae bacterium]